MNYNNVIELLTEKFPRIRDELVQNEYLTDLPHCIFEIILIPYVKELCINKDKENLLKFSEFLELMAICRDIKVNELLNVSFLEPVVLSEKEMITVMRPLLGKKSLEELSYWEKMYR